MLLDLREKVRSSKPIKYTLITIITIPFALVGIGSYLSGGSVASVAEVNGEPIDQYQLDRAYQQQRQQLASMFGGQLPEAFANEELLREQALQQLISQQVLESEVARQKFAVGDATLGRAIRNLPAFQTDGRFDSEAYQLQLRSSGMTVPVFEQSFRDDTAMNQFRTGISDTSFTLPQEAALMAALSGQTRTIEAVQFDFAVAKESIDVSDEDVQAYFDENADNYQFPERTKIQYVELESAAIAASVDISDEQAEAFYEDNRGSYMLPEQREASHILLDAAEGDEADQINQLNDIKARVEAGESFADLAAEFSDDVGSADLGGSLGVISIGAMVPEFEDAVFALEAEGDLSAPVVSEFGVHLIKLDKIIAESGKPFEDVREQIISEMQQDEADRDFFDLREQLVELAFDNPDSLEPASEETGLELNTSDWLDSETDSGAILTSPAVTAAMRSVDVLDDGNNSDLLEVGDRHVLVLRVVEHEGPRPKTIDDVRDEVIDTIKGERATENLQAGLEDAMNRLAAGETAAAIADGNDLASALEQLLLDRSSDALDRNIVSSIFAMPKPAEGGEAVTSRETLASGDLLALRLDSVDVADTEESAEPVLANPNLGGTEFQALVDSLRESADVEIIADL